MSNSNGTPEEDPDKWTEEWGELLTSWLEEPSTYICLFELIFHWNKMIFIKTFSSLAPIYFPDFNFCSSLYSWLHPLPIHQSSVVITHHLPRISFFISPFSCQASTSISSSPPLRPGLSQSMAITSPWKYLRCTVHKTCSSTAQGKGIISDLRWCLSYLFRWPLTWNLFFKKWHG